MNRSIRAALLCLALPGGWLACGAAPGGSGTGSGGSSGVAGAGATTASAGGAAGAGGASLDACGGCAPGRLCDPAQGCLDCATTPCPEAILYAGWDGAGTDCSLPRPCALTTAQGKARALAPAMTGDVLVYLLGGTYVLSAPLAFTQADSGTHGHEVVYRGLPKATSVLCAGVMVAGAWTLVDAKTGVYRTHVGALAATARQLYVDGERAVRARGPEKPQGFTKTKTGYLAPDASMASWKAPSALEIVAFRDWKAFRCPVASIVGRAITMAEPCWSNTQAQQGPGFDYTMNQPEWLENAPELLDAPGEFYADATTGDLDYLPRPGQPVTHSVFIVPRFEAVLSGTGTLDAPIHDLAFEGLTFSYATWLAPGTPEGYADLQAGIIATTAAGTPAKTLANVAFRAARRVRLKGDTFTFLGGAALSFEYGSQDNEIVGNRFADISGGAIAIGDVTHTTDHHPTDARAIVKGNLVHDNFITRVGVEYQDGEGIWAGYTDGTVIDHNDLFDLPYTAISVGWGWGAVDPGGSAGFTTPTPCQNNRITSNVITDAMRTLFDGGSVYVLGSQPGSVMEGNVASAQGSPYAALYLDNGTRHYQVTGNVVADAPYWELVQADAPKAYDNTVTGNFTDADDPFPVAPDPSNVLSGNTVVTGAWPAAALARIAVAGLEPAYQALHLPDVALGKPATASSEYDAGHVAGLANDGRSSDGWASSATDAMPWWQVDLGAPYAIGGLELVTRWELDQPVTRQNFAVWASDDPTFATHTVLAVVGAPPLAFHAIWSRVTGGPKHRYVRVVKTASEPFFIAELRVLGAP